MRRIRPAVLAVVAAMLTAAAVPAVRAAVTDPVAGRVPVLHRALKPGGVRAVPQAPVTPTPKTVDGSIDDWTGAATGFGGTAGYSHGEFIYTDHIFDAYGADDGADAERLAVLDPLAEAIPETYRLDPVFQADVPGQIGLPSPEALAADERYGDLEHQDNADLLEIRVAASPTDAGTIHLLARTTTLIDPATTNLIVLADTSNAKHKFPWHEPNTDLVTGTAEVAILITPTGGTAFDMVNGGITSFPAAANASGWTNAIEAALPAALVAPGGTARLAVASATRDPQNQTLAIANVAFRFDEPVTTWWDKQQALALFANTIDPFFASIDLAKLRGGATDAHVPSTGYLDRVFTSSESISAEQGQDGIHQHYGMYVPSAFTRSQGAKPLPATYWMHWRGGKAHSAASVSPRIMRSFGETPGGFVIAPRGRGTSTWYVGKGQVDFLEVWDDAMALLAIDANRVYVTGHSMGGWASYLLPALHPDRFAAALPVEGPVTQGAFFGVDLPGCDEFRYDDYTPCYVETNGGDARTQHTLRMLDNYRGVPIGIFQGVIDELVPVTGTLTQVARLQELGYRYRAYLFPTYEHYTHPVVDEWEAGARYLHSHVRDPNPERVTFVRDMPFERTVETGPNQAEPGNQQFDFDNAYWMSGLVAADPVDGRAHFDGRTFGLGRQPTITVPEVGGPASGQQLGPYLMAGQRWIPSPLDPEPAAQNRFEVTVSGATAVTLDLARMGLSPSGLVGTVTTDTPLELTLGSTTLTIPSGTHEVHV